MFPLSLPTELISFVLKLKKAFSRCLTTFEHLRTPVVTRSMLVAGGEAQICGLGIGLKLCLRGPVGCRILWVIKGCERLHALQKYLIATGLHTLFFNIADSTKTELWTEVICVKIVRLKAIFQDGLQLACSLVTLSVYSSPNSTIG